MVTIPKNTREEIRIEPVNYRGKDLIDIRVWFKTFDDRGWTRTKKGITIAPEVANSLQNALQGLVQEPKLEKIED